MSDFTLQDAIDLATFGHRKQFDKAGSPYINHCLRVMYEVQRLGAPEHVQMAAVLHDVTEDTAFTPGMLLALGVPDEAVDIVLLLDRGLSRFCYDDEREKGNIACTPDEFYYLNIHKHPGALMVKKADIRDNTHPWRMEYLPVETQERLHTKYAKALELLK